MSFQLNYEVLQKGNQNFLIANVVTNNVACIQNCRYGHSYGDISKNVKALPVGQSMTLILLCIFF